MGQPRRDDVEFKSPMLTKYYIHIGVRSWAIYERVTARLKRETLERENGEEFSQYWVIFSSNKCFDLYIAEKGKFSWKGDTVY